MRAFERTLAFMLAYGFMAALRVEAVTTWFVDWSHTSGTQNGSSWETAYPTLQAALGPATNGDTILVRGSVTAGQAMYRLTSSADTFLLDGLTIVGGMSGTSTNPLDSDPETYETVLSGAISGGGNARHVVSALGSETFDGALRGFVVEDGAAAGTSGNDSLGGGVLIVAATPVIHECTIRSNTADDRGGGIAILYGDATISQCEISGNTAAAWGGGVYIAAAEPVVYDCTIKNNTAQRGAGMTIDGSLALIADVSGCLFKDNIAGNRGGGLWINSASAQVTHSTFEENEAPLGGGTYVYVESGSAPTAPENEAWDGVGPHFSQCDFVENIAISDDEDVAPVGGGATLSTSLPNGYDDNDDTEFVDCNFIDNRISYEWLDYDCGIGLGAGMSISGSPEVTDCSFVGNGPWNNSCLNEIVINGGGVAINNYISSTRNHTAAFAGCVFRQNGHIVGTATCTLPNDVSVTSTDYIHHGGGVYIQRPSYPIFANPYPSGFDQQDPESPRPVMDATFVSCDFTDNRAGNGAGVFMDRSAATFNLCNFAGNDADGHSAHVYDDANDDCEAHTGPTGYVVLHAAYGGGALSTYRLSYFSIVDCKFVRNVASLWHGGAIYVYQGSTMDADRCYFLANEAPSPFVPSQQSERYNDRAGVGGALWVNSSCLGIAGACDDGGEFGVGDFHAVANVNNSLFVDNFAKDWGGAVYNELGGITNLVNCTIMHNTALWTGGVMEDPATTTDMPDESVTTVYNSILWRNPSFFGATQLPSQLFAFGATFVGDPPVPSGWPKAEFSCIADDGMLDVYGTDEFVSAADPVIPDVHTFGESAWTEPALYDPATGLTTFTSDEAGFPTLTKKILVTFNAIGDPMRSLIISNDDETITVLGDVSAFDDADADIAVEDYEVAFGTPCYDTGEDSLLLGVYSDFDILLQTRIVGDKFEIDMGCFEQQISY